MTAITMSKGSMSVYGANGLNVGNIGQMSGSATFTLTETADNSKETVFSIIQADSNDAVAFNMAGNDGNLSFNGYNIFASFGAECQRGYNVEMNTVNSSFDFSNSQSGVMLQATGYSMNNVVQLSSGGNCIYSEVLDGSLTASGQSETFLFNNMVTDGGYANTYLSTGGSFTRFETTETSEYAYMQGGVNTDVFYLRGKNGVMNGVDGYNVFTTAQSKTGMPSSNVVIGGIGTNVYNDYGVGNMYQGAYVLYEDSAYEGMNGYDTVRMNGSYGIARVDASRMPEGYDPSIYFNGSYNIGFTGDTANFTCNGREFSLSYKDVLNGKYTDYIKPDGTAWTISEIYGSNAPVGTTSYAYQYSLLSKILDP